MPFRQTSDTHTPYGLIAFDKNGAERRDDPDGVNGLMSERLLETAGSLRPSNIFLFSHGWKGDIASAIDQYNRWIDAMARLNTDISRMGPGFRPLWIGLHWPSQPWGEEDLGAAGSFDVSATQAAAPTQLDAYLDRLNLNDSLRARELLGVIFRENRVNAGAAALPENVVEAYDELSAMIGYQSQGAGADPAADNAPFDAQAAFQSMNSAGVSFGGGFLGGLLGPLRQLSFWTMKKRARTVGEVGMHDFVGKLQGVAPQARVHLMGHSFGCIVVSSICGGPKGTTALPRPIDSLALVQGAVSLWSYADNIPSTGGAGYFNTAYHRPAVSGPIMTTRSRFDIACGAFYPAAVSLVLQSPSFAIDPSLIVWGALGAFGIQGIPGVVDQPMLNETGDYRFENKIYNLESSEFIKKMDGASGAHSDIDGPQVAHALWQAALAASQPVHLAASGEMTMAAAASGGATVTTNVAGAPTGVGLPQPGPGAPAVHVASAAPVSDLEAPLPFGIEAATGNYLPSINPADLDHIDADPNLVRVRAAVGGMSHLGISAELSPDVLSQTGWGLLLPAGMDATRKAQLLDALKPLLDRRREEAGDLFMIFQDANGYQAGQSAEQWLLNHGADPTSVVVDPKQGVPYYMMLVGSPDEIPFSFQYELDAIYAVGRLYFDQIPEYAQYAQNVVDFEKDPTPQSRAIACFNTRNEGDRATALLHDQVAVNLALGSNGSGPVGAALGFSMHPMLAGNATKANLLGLLRDGVQGVAPALLFTGSHGVSFRGDPQQAMKQGAILTQDWAGGPAGPNTYLTAAEIPSNARLQGAMHFFFACYSAGCPQFDTYVYDPNRQPVQIAPRTLVSRLPQRMLLSGAQAVIGHIDQAFAFSFQNMGGAGMAQNFRQPLVRLLQGRRVGDAMDEFDHRWGSLSAVLAQSQLKRLASPAGSIDMLVANRWVARDDARNYVVLGDPACRLKPTAPPAAPGPQATGTSFDISAGPAVTPSAAPAESFALHPDAKPVLNFRDFSGLLNMQAAVSPDASYQLAQSVLATAGAGSKVDAYIYAISAPHMMNLLKGARDRGATVRVMYDPQQMRAADAQTLIGMGLDVRRAPSSDPRNVFTVCHQKFVVVDRKVVLLESANWAASSIPFRQAGQPRKKGNREWLIRVNEKDVASWYADLFQADWDIPSIGVPGFAIEAVAPVPVASFRAPRAQAPRDFPIMTFTGQPIKATPLTSPDNYFDQVNALIRTASQRVWIQQQYIEAAGGTSVPSLLESISRRGSQLDVRLMVSSKFPENWDKTKETVRDAGLISKLRAINLDNFIHCHNKGVIVDDAVVVTSTNWSENSIRRAREAGLLIRSKSVAGYFAQVFADDWTTGWTVATADSHITSFDISSGADQDPEVDPADRV